MDTSNDYYTVLGVDPQASVSAIKAAFKKLALQYHPDVYKGEDAEQRMRNLLQAYQTLSDPAARKAYDERSSGARTTPSRSFAERDEYRGQRASADRERYVFLDASQPRHAPLVLHLNAIDYRLTSAQAERLRLTGIVRGLMSEPVTSASGSSYCCQRCRHSWSAAVKTPTTCPACHAQDWAEYLLLHCSHCQAVFVSPEIRDALRGNALYNPYELFPLCPHCRRSQWCPAENERVAQLRAAAARRNALLMSGVVGVCLLLVVLIALVFLR